MVEYTERYRYDAGYHVTVKRTNQIYILAWGDVYDIALSEKSKLQGNTCKNDR